MGDSSQSLNNISVGAQDVGDVATEVAGRTLVPVYTANGSPDGSGFAIDYDNLSDFPEQPLSLDLTWHYLNGSTAGSGYPAERTEQVNNSDAFFVGLQDKPAVNMPADYYILKKNTSNAFEWAENKDLNYVTAVSAGNSYRVKPESEVYTNLSTKVKRSGQGSSESASQIADRYIGLSSTVPNSSNNEVAVLKNPANTQQLVTEVLDWDRPSFFVGEIDSNQNTIDDSAVAHTSKNNSGMQDTKSRPDYGHTITSTDTKTPRNDFITRKLAHTKREIIDSSTRISQNLLNEPSNSYQAGNVLKVKGYRETEWAGNYTIDSTLSTTSTNAVETGPVKTLYNTKMNLATNDSGTNTGTDKYYFKYNSGGNTWVTETSLNLQEPEAVGTTNTTFSSTITNDSVTSAAIKTKLESMPQVDTKKGHYTDKMLRKGTNGFEIVEESTDTIGGLISGNLEYPLDQDLTLPTGVNLIQHSSKDVSYDFRKSKRVKKTGTSSTTNFSNAKIVTKNNEYLNEYFDKTNIQPSLSAHIGDNESTGILWRIPSTPNIELSGDSSIAFSSHPAWQAIGRTMAIRVKRKSTYPASTWGTNPDGNVSFSTPYYSGYFAFHAEGTTPTLQFFMNNVRTSQINSNMKIELNNNNLTEWNFMAVSVQMQFGLFSVRCCINGEDVISQTGISYSNAPTNANSVNSWGDLKFFVGFGNSSGTPDYTQYGGTGGAWFITDTGNHQWGSSQYQVIHGDRNAGHLFRNRFAGSRNVDQVSHAGFWDYALNDDQLKSLYCDGHVTFGDTWNSAIYKFPSQHVTDLKVYNAAMVGYTDKFYQPRSIGLPRQFLEDRGRIKVGETVGITLCAYASNGKESEDPYQQRYNATQGNSNGYPGNSSNSNNPLDDITTLITTPGNGLCIGTRAGSNGSFTETRTDRSTTVADANKFYTVWYGGLSSSPGQVNGTTVGTFAYNDDSTIKFEPIQHAAAFYVVTADYTHADGGEGVLNINFYANGVKQGNTLTLGASNNSPVEVAAKLQTVGYNPDGTWGYYTSNVSRTYTRGEFIIGDRGHVASGTFTNTLYNSNPQVRISRCGIWDRALTASEIAELGVLGFNDPAKTAWVDSIYSYDVNGSNCDDDIEFGKETMTLHDGTTASLGATGIAPYASNHVSRKNLLFYYHHSRAPADFGTGIVTDIGPYGNHGKLYYSNDSNAITDEGDYLNFTGGNPASNYIKLFNWATIYDGEGQHNSPDHTDHFRNEVTFIIKYQPQWSTSGTYSAIMSDSVGGFFIGKDTGDDYLQVQIGGTSDGSAVWSGGSHNLGYSPATTTSDYVFIVSMKRDHNGHLDGRSSFNGELPMYTWYNNATPLPGGNWESQTIQIGQEINSRAFIGKIYQVAILNRGISEFEVTDIYNTLMKGGVLFESDEYQIDNRLSCFQKTTTVFKHTDNKIDNVKGLNMTASNQIHLPKFALPTNFAVEFVAEVKTGTEYSQGMSDTYKNYHSTIGNGDILKFKDGDEEFKISRTFSLSTNSIPKTITITHKNFSFTSSNNVFDGFKHITVSTNPVSEVFSATWTQRYAKVASASAYDDLYHNWDKIVTTGDLESYEGSANGRVFRNAATWANNNDPVTGQSMSNYFPVYAPTRFSTSYHWFPGASSANLAAAVATVTFSHNVRLFGSYGYDYAHTFIDSTWTYAPGNWWTHSNGGNHGAYFYYKDFDAGTYNLAAAYYFCYQRPGDTATVKHHHVDLKVNGVSETLLSHHAPKEIASTTNIAANSGTRYLNPGCMYMNFTKLGLYQTSTTTNLSTLATTLYNSYKKTDPHNIIDSTNYNALTPISGSREIFKHNVGYGNDTTELIGLKNNNGSKITNTFNSPEKTFYTKIYNSDLILKSKEDSAYGLKYSSGSFYVINNNQEELLNVNGGTSASDDRIKYSETEIAGDQIIDRLSQLTFKKYLKTNKIYPELEEKASQMTKAQFKKYLDSQKIKYTTEIGLIAQDLQQNENYRHLVRNTASTDNSPYEVKYNDIITQAICGIKHLNSELEEVTRKTNEMMSRIS